MTAGLATHMAVNDHYNLWSYGGIVALGRKRQLTTVLRKGDKICEILAPRVFHAVRQDDNAFGR